MHRVCLAFGVSLLLSAAACGNGDDTLAPIPTEAGAKDATSPAPDAASPSDGGSKADGGVDASSV